MKYVQYFKTQAEYQVGAIDVEPRMIYVKETETIYLRKKGSHYLVKDGGHYKTTENNFIHLKK